MVVKSTIMLLLYYVPICLVIFGSFSSVPLLFFLYLLSGLGMAGIGMGIMHDAIHESYSSNKWINKLMAQSIHLIGSNREMWRIQHNVLHHSFTNIQEHDEDINAPGVLRFSPHSERKKIHKYQHLYAWFFYSLMSLNWVLSKDFVNFFRYKKKGLIPNKKVRITTFLSFILWKTLFFVLFLILPIWFTSYPVYMIVLALLFMQFVTGLITAIVFQMAHVMENAAYPLPNTSGEIENDWLVHQLQTTCNFSGKNNFAFWALGGLTNQIEHHLFPNISHVHYKNIAPIVEQTAKEFNLPYNNNGSFGSALYQHFRMLKLLGVK